MRVSPRPGLDGLGHVDHLWLRHRRTGNGGQGAGADDRFRARAAVGQHRPGARDGQRRERPARRIAGRRGAGDEQQQRVQHLHGVDHQWILDDSRRPRRAGAGGRLRRRLALHLGGLRCHARAEPELQSCVRNRRRGRSALRPADSSRRPARARCCSKAWRARGGAGRGFMPRSAVAP